MKTIIKSSDLTRFLLTLAFILQGVVNLPEAFSNSLTENDDYIEFKGEVLDYQTNDPVASAFLSVNETNISTVTNADGKFSLKIPSDITTATVTITSLGYKSKTLPLDYFKVENTQIFLEESVQELEEIAIFTSENAENLIRKMLKNRGSSFDEVTEMTAFYRENIQKRNRNVSLSEAVVKIYKQPYKVNAKDDISIIKARKSADYERLDTLALKLRGGPFNTLYMDVMKYPEFLFNKNQLDIYNFSFDKPARIHNRYLYVVNFEQKNKSEPWYYGKLFVDAETVTLVKAVYNLNVDNRKTASELFVRKKPGKVRVYPISVLYQVDYRESDGKWYYGYSNAELEFVVNWKRKLFNSRYTVNSEMAVTDWGTYADGKIKKDESFINPAIIMADDVSGFADVDFWGNNNIIEPEKSIQNAIDKIQQQIRNDKN